VCVHGRLVVSGPIADLTRLYPLIPLPSICSLARPASLLGFHAAVSRIALVSPERARQIEGILARLAQSGQLRGRVTENQLIDLLEQVR
jgi:hypothetical protein